MPVPTEGWIPAGKAKLEKKVYYICEFSISVIIGNIQI